MVIPPVRGDFCISPELSVIRVDRLEIDGRQWIWTRLLTALGIPLKDGPGETLERSPFTVVLYLTVWWIGTTTTCLIALFQV